MLSEVLQVLRGASKVGSALVTTQGEQLRLMACNSSLGAGLRVAQDAAEGLVSNFMASSDVVRISGLHQFKLWLFNMSTCAPNGVIDKMMD